VIGPPTMRRKGFGVGLVVAFAALLGSAALSILILLHLRNMGGPDLLTRVPPEMVLVRLAVTVPLPLVGRVREHVREGEGHAA
jgi:hypothetical protein